MNIRQEFEAWAIDHGYDIDESKIFGRLYHCDESIRALQVWQAATSRHEVKIKALVDALEGVAAMARCGQLDNFIGEPWLNSVHQALAVGDWPDDSREAYLELKQAIAQEQEIARRCYTCKSFAIRNVDKCRSCNKDYSNWEPKP